MTTSWTALIHGNLPMAFHAHPLGPVMYLFFTACAVAALVASLRGQRLVTDSREFNRVLMVVMLTFLGFGVVRMAVMDHYRSATEVAWVKVMNTHEAK